MGDATMMLAMCMCAHASVRRYTSTYMCAHARTHVSTHACTFAHMHTRTHALTHALTHTLMRDAHMHTLTYKVSEALADDDDNDARRIRAALLRDLTLVVLAMPEDEYATTI